MTIRSFATALLEATGLEQKLEPPPERLSDREPGPALRVQAPARPQALRIVPARQVKVPPAAGMGDPAQRARILHALANHELQAAELFAWALLCFADAPPSFRRGLLGILADEQRHCRLYLDCMQALNVRFGDHPVTGHFWNKIQHVHTPLQFVCTMGLTFENANLDFALEYARGARNAGDERTATILEQVHDDEIRHVSFAWRWMHKLKQPRDSAWTTYLESVAWPLGPARARGKRFDVSSRVAAGLDSDFIGKLQGTVPKRPGGAPR
jgi:uncharacterized ferritin-like protein (DUF455 family)